MESDNEVEDTRQTEQQQELQMRLQVEQHQQQLCQQQHQADQQEQQQHYSPSMRHPCADHFTSYPQLMKRAQLIPMQHHNLL